MFASRAIALLRRRPQLIAKPLQLSVLRNLILGPCNGENLDWEGSPGTLRRWSSASESASSPSLSIWRRKKEMGKEGIFVVQTLKRLARGGDRGAPRLEAFVKSHVSRLVRTDLLAVLSEFQRQDLFLLSIKIYNLVRREIWYRPDMYFYRDMILMLARNKCVEETRQVWADLRAEGVLFDQHTYGDIVRAFLDSGLPSLAMEFYDEMRSSSDPPLFLPFRVMLKGLIPYPDLRQRVREDFVELFPHIGIYDPPEDLFDEQDDEILKERLYSPD